jgi:hypothetical protein
MQIINVIVSHPEQGINEMESFGILYDEYKYDVVQTAEECFIETAVKYQFGEDAKPSEEQDDFRDDCNEALSDGWIDAGGHTITVVLSSIDDVQP